MMHGTLQRVQQVRRGGGEQGNALGFRVRQFAVGITPAGGEQDCPAFVAHGPVIFYPARAPASVSDFNLHLGAIKGV